MAFINFPFPGAKLKIKSVQIDHKSEKAEISFSVENQGRVIFNNQILLSGLASVRHAELSSNALSTESQFNDLPVGSFFFISNSPSWEVLMNRGGRPYMKTEDGSLKDAGGHAVFVNKNTQEARVFSSETHEWNSVPYSQVAAYEVFFSIEAMNVAGTNVVRQAYLYLKTLPDFINCESDE